MSSGNDSEAGAGARISGSTDVKIGRVKLTGAGDGVHISDSRKVVVDEIDVVRHRQLHELGLSNDQIAQIISKANAMGGRDHVETATKAVLTGTGITANIATIAGWIAGLM